MKQIYGIVILLGVVVSVTVMGQSWLDQSPPAKQSYHDVNHTDDAQTVNAESVEKPADAQPVVSNTPPSNAPALSTTEVNAAELNALSNKTDQMMTQITQLNQTVVTLSQTVAQLQANQAGHSTDDDVGHREPPETKILEYFSHLNPNVYVGLGAGGGLLVGLGFVAGRLCRKQLAVRKLQVAPQSSAVKQQALTAEDQESKVEYDFMSTDEAIPAMLDLARSYLAMDNVCEAKAVLEKVQARGDKAQCKEARMLLAEIANKTNSRNVNRT